jgi:hypothetical protein
MAKKRSRVSKKTRALFKKFRVELHPGTDRWMMGDRYGDAVSVIGSGKHKGHVRVKLDKSGKTLRFHPDNVRPID